MIRDNYFWRVYLTGSYTQTCCPNYLRKEYFSLLQAIIGKVYTYDYTIIEFLKRNPGTYTHFVLLDHQDWLAWHDSQALREEWQLLLDNSRPGSKILMRSALADISFLPEVAKSSLRFFPEKSNDLHKQDRVGTYGSLHLAEIL
jgi:S-adenosylmethionine-diacylglycerol 3-amino-3-carboxypropyl transferase